MTDTADPVFALVRERDLDRYLASLYAPPAARTGLLALHALDLEMAEVARTTTEPMLGQIRLAWWREQLEGLDAGKRPAQPVLAAVADHILPAGISGASLEPLEDAYLALLEGDLAAYAVSRSRLFEAAATLLGGDTANAKRLGEGWALVEAARRGSDVDATLLNRAADLLAPAATARPLIGLAALARRDLAALRAGRRPGHRGSPGRQARLLWSIISGR
ncbi:squalene/phytoene synthase family protein [Sphingoaurantiacus capsulatus]|uniref:Squalene/phytoene synthase family protein n=1 Tax=Sphingoaurantiacus capsulatus TaxID=1771310 RepID=A0ABV7XDF4_9SPHN